MMLNQITPHRATVGSDPPKDRMRVLLVTDRPFMEPVDGSAHNYRMWLRVLTDLDFEVSVLSFNRFSTKWTLKEIEAVEAVTNETLILEAFRSRLSAAVTTLASGVWRVLIGRRYLPLRVERLLRRHQRNRIADFLQGGRFDAIVVNKLRTTTLIGRQLLNEHKSIKLIDMHDNFPRRESLDSRILLQMIRDNRSLFWISLKPRYLLGLINWAAESRTLQEEASLLSAFDHVVFNARQEGETYARAGVPRQKISTLPLPHPPDPVVLSSPDPRPYQIGLIASGSLSNIEAVDFLARAVLPRLQNRGVRLLIAGTISSYASRLLASETTTVMGWIDDVALFYQQVEVVLVPLLSGTGVSVKTMEAAAYGAAIVSTSIGARGVDLIPGQGIIVADDADAFAATVCQVLDNPQLRIQLRRDAHDGLRANHSRNAFLAGVNTLLRPDCIGRSVGCGRLKQPSA